MLIEIALMRGETPRLMPHLLPDEAAAWPRIAGFPAALSPR